MIYSVIKLTRKGQVMSIDKDDLMVSVENAIQKVFPKAQTEGARWQEVFEIVGNDAGKEVDEMAKDLEQKQQEADGYEDQLDDVEGELEQLKADTISREDEKEHEAMVASFHYYATGEGAGSHG
jgi:hypothetical protein